MSENDIPQSDESQSEVTQGYLSGQLLVAMPTMSDQRFERTVIYLCAHTEDGAMGLVVNKLLDSMSFEELLEQLEIKTGDLAQQIRVHSGGPVEAGRGFVLHSGEYDAEGTMKVDGEVALTASVDILREIAAGDGPDNALLALGYSGWGPGQLETEIQANGWLHVPSDASLLFADDVDGIWNRAIAKIGFDASMLSGEAGHA